ncbi:MAG: hypothetical protein ABSG77_04715 [Candidatus Acidiferrum sp.]|jgi:hypothetical protein
MEVIGAEKAEKEFKELLSAYWAAQLAQLGAQPDSGDSAARNGDSVKAQEAGK